MIRAHLNDTMYEVAAVFHRPPFILPPETGMFIRYVAANVDINVNTLHGNNTLHIMCIIQIVNSKKFDFTGITYAMNKTSASEDFSAKALVLIQIYQNDSVVGYSKINVQHFTYRSERVLKKVDVI